MTEVDMTDTLKSKIEKIKHPQNYYETPDALTKDPELSFEEKKKADHPQLGQVKRAKNKLRDKPKRNASRGSS
jgi:hypothetical protein